MDLKKVEENEQNSFSRQYSGTFLQREHSRADNASELELRELEQSLRISSELFVSLSTSVGGIE